MVFFRAYVCLQMAGLCKNIKIKARASMVDSIFNYCFTVYLKCWLLMYTSIYGMAATVAQRGA